MKKMKKILLLMLVFSICLSSVLLLFTSTADARTYVNGYYRKDGTYVRGYWRGGSSSSSSYSSNYSTTTTRRTVNLYKGNTSIGSADINSLVYVNGYYRKDGTYVRPHFRTYPNHYLEDNFSHLGISSLKPLDKYPNFRLSNKNNVSMVEKYLLYNLIDENLNEEHLKSLKSYAEKIASSGEKEGENTIEIGKLFYKSIGIGEYSALQLSRFDNLEEIAFENYLFFKIYNSAYKKNIEKVIDLIPYYASLLKTYSIDSSAADRTKKFGDRFYRIIGMYGTDDISTEIEMDMLQSFERANDRDIKIMYQTLTQNQSYDRMKIYLESVLEAFNIEITFDIELSMISYYIYLDSLFSFPGDFFYEGAKEEGIKFYKSIGFEEDFANVLTMKDILIIMQN